MSNNILNKPYTDKQYADFVCINQGLNRYEDDKCVIMYLDSESVTDGVVTDISQTPEYKAEQRLIQIDIEIAKAEQDYLVAIDTPIQYTNEMLYKPKWVEQTYMNLLSAGTIMPSMYPLLLWDATELQENAMYFTQPELMALTTFLAQKQQQLFNIKKTTINELLIEKQEILNPSMEEIEKQ